MNQQASSSADSVHTDARIIRFSCRYAIASDYVCASYHLYKFNFYVDGWDPDSAFVLPQPSEYRLNPDNFAKTMRTVKKVKNQIAIWGKDFKPFVEKIMEDALCLFKNIQLCMDHMEERINKKLDEMSIPDFAKVIEEVRHLRADVD